MERRMMLAIGLVCALSCCLPETGLGAEAQFGPPPGAVFARNFSDMSIDQARWDSEEMPEYARRVIETGTERQWSSNFLMGF